MKPEPAAPRPQSGFTLVEAMVAISLALALAALAYPSLQQLYARQQHLQVEGELGKLAQLWTRRMHSQGLRDPLDPKVLSGMPKRLEAGGHAWRLEFKPSPRGAMLSARREGSRCVHDLLLAEGSLASRWC